MANRGTLLKYLISYSIKCDYKHSRSKGSHITNKSECGENERVRERAKENGNAYENCDRFKFMIIMCTFTFNSSQIISLALSIVYMVLIHPQRIYSWKNVYYIDKNNSFR